MYHPFVDDQVYRIERQFRERLYAGTPVWPEGVTRQVLRRVLVKERKEDLRKSRREAAASYLKIERENRKAVWRFSPWNVVPNDQIASREDIEAAAELLCVKA